MNELFELALHYEIQYTVTEEEVELDLIKGSKIYHYVRDLPDVVDIEDIKIATLKCIKEFYSEV